jgi:hypothetical protein
MIYDKYEISYDLVYHIILAGLSGCEAVAARRLLFVDLRIFLWQVSLLVATL